MFRTETGIDGDETREAAKHEARTDGEKKRKGNFSDNERAAERLVAANAAPESARIARVLAIHTDKPERGAPKAERTASSRRRPVPRMRRRFATLAHAIRRRNPTDASNTQSGRRTPRVTSSSIGKTLALQPLLLSGRVWTVKLATRSMSCWAWLSETPGLRRAITVRKRPPFHSSERVKGNGVHTSDLNLG